MKPYFLAYCIIFIKVIILYFLLLYTIYHTCWLCYQGRFIVILVLGPGNIYLAIKVAQGFGYLAFRTVGAAESLHSML